MKNPKKTIMEKNFLPFNKKLSKVIGIETNMLLSILADTQDYFDNKPFYKTQKSVEDEIGMTKKIYLKSKKILVENGLVKSWLADNSTPYFYFDETCIQNIQYIIDNGVFPNGTGVFQNETGGVPKENRGCSEMEQGVFPNGTGSVLKGNTNNNKEQEQIEITNNQEENNNNKNVIENFDTNEVGVEDEIDLILQKGFNFTKDEYSSTEKEEVNPLTQKEIQIRNTEKYFESIGLNKDEVNYKPSKNTLSVFEDI